MRLSGGLRGRVRGNLMKEDDRKGVPTIYTIRSKGSCFMFHTEVP